MRRLRGFFVFVVLGFLAYLIFSDPDLRKRIVGAIESSTGVDLTGAEALMEDASRTVGKATDTIIGEIGDTITDPKFHQSLERLGKGALDKLNEVDLNRLKRELSSSVGDVDYDAILEKYLSRSDDS